ncbi:MAG: 4Fe-4S binding protein [Clostridia bacterium]|nr:4Fe-4S binding protein [Clostridia bacterium]
MAHMIDQSKCIHCATCEVECPFHAVLISAEGVFSIDTEKCRDCRKCAEACPMDAISKQV